MAQSTTSRKHPYASLNRRIREIQTLHAVRNMYDLHERLPIHTPTQTSGVLPPSYHDPVCYPEVTLLHPCRTLTFAKEDLDDLHRRIAIHLATRYNVSVSVARQSIPADIIQWGRIQIKDSDIVNSHLGCAQREENQRNATFIQYELLVDIHAHHHSRRPEFESVTFFGRLDRVFVCELPPTPALGLMRTTPLILMDVKICNTVQDRYGFYEYTTYRHSEVIDGEGIRALVGRIQDRGKWVFVKRKGAMEHADYNDDDDDDDDN